MFDILVRYNQPLSNDDLALSNCIDLAQRLIPASSKMHALTCVGKETNGFWAPWTHLHVEPMKWIELADIKESTYHLDSDHSVLQRSKVGVMLKLWNGRFYSLLHGFGGD